MGEKLFEMQLSPHETALRRTKSSASATTYHSFHDIELYDPVTVRRGEREEFKPSPMQRHDSGYASIPSGSKSGDSHSSGRRTSTTSSSSSHARPRTRPSIRRAAKSTPTPRASMSSYSLQRPRSQQHASAYFQFPSLEGQLAFDEDVHELDEPLYPPPPQTTHYWTSDHTRRLEYAAIDNATQGVKGWILKHLVPDCFVPKRNRRLGFDDDDGSVRRYRLELDCDDHAEKGCKKSKKMGWLVGRC